MGLMSESRKSTVPEASRLARVFPDHPLMDRRLELGDEDAVAALSSLDELYPQPSRRTSPSSSSTLRSPRIPAGPGERPPAKKAPPAFQLSSAALPGGAPFR